MVEFAKETLPISLEDEMRKSYLDYAMSVIVGRALPDVRDGLKPVHRRVLFAMQESNNVWNRPYVKCARVVGEVMGKFHPHGDQAIYDTLVRMAQDFSLRYPLVDGQGNFGSIDGDNAAAMRYTECRLDRIADELLADIDQETVDFVPNYDGKEQEPSVLPTRLPNLLINGSSGIAVGMATNIPPHHIGEVLTAVLHLLANPEASIDTLMEFIPAPDFPTGGLIFGVSGIREAYHSGKGRVIMRAKTHFEPIGSGDRQAIVVDEIPYQVNKKNLIERMAELVREKKIEGISDARDESDKSGMRLVIELKRGEMPEVVLNNLFKHTQLQDSFGINMVALSEGQPRLMNLKQILQAFLSHRREVITRRTVYQLKKARERGHVLEGLAVALANIDEFIALIKAAPSPPEAKIALMTRAWDSSLVREMLARTEGSVGNESLYRPAELALDLGLQSDGQYRLSETQAQEILQMRLQRLTGLEQDKILNEYREVMAEITDLIDILRRPERVTAIIQAESQTLLSAYALENNSRRSVIEFNSAEIDTEDLIAPEERVITVSHAGYVKAQALADYSAQRRGGRGKSATQMKEDDWIEHLFVGHTHDYVLFFSDRGRVYWQKVWELPTGSRAGRGRPMVNLFPLEPNEKITVTLPLVGNNTQFPEDRFIFFATAAGIVKKTPLSEFSNPRKNGIIAIDLDQDDVLIGVALTDGSHDVMLFSDEGKAVRFAENDVRSVGRGARGVRGMRLAPAVRVIALLVAGAPEADGATEYSVLTATENGFGKRTAIGEYTRHGRGTKGMLAIRTSERNGKVVAATLAQPNQEVMLISSEGVLIRTRVAEIREMGRTTQGVRLIALDNNSHLSGVYCVSETEDDDSQTVADVGDDSPTPATDDAPPAADDDFQLES